MAKIDFNKSLNFDKKTLQSKKENASEVAKSMIGDENALSLLHHAKIFDIPVDKVDEREINEFDEISLTSLKDSIYNTGLQHNIVVKVKGNRYETISGSRRLQAYKELHSQYPDDERFTTIPAKICQIIGEGIPNDNYVQITSEQEQLIYLDTNFDSRQLSVDTAIAHIDYLVDKIDNSSEFYEKALLKSRENTKKIYDTVVIDKATVISNILTDDLGFKGWSRTTIWRLLKIREKDPAKLQEIKNGSKTVTTVFKELFPDGNKKKVRLQSYNSVYKKMQQVSDCFSGKVVSSDNDVEVIKKLIQLCDDVKDRATKDLERLEV